MPERIDYAIPSTRRRDPRLLFAAIVFAFASAAVTYLTAAEAVSIWHAGLYAPGVSFEGRLSMKAYHVQWPPFVWIVPLAGIGLGIWAERNGWQLAGRRSWIVAAFSAASWLAMDILWS